MRKGGGGGPRSRRRVKSKPTEGSIPGQSGRRDRRGESGRRPRQRGGDRRAPKRGNTIVQQEGVNTRFAVVRDQVTRFLPIRLRVPVKSRPRTAMGCHQNLSS